jgi:hypothetical protein
MLLQAATQLAFASRRVGAELLRFRRAGTAQCALARARLCCLCDSGFREHDRCQADDEKINSHVAPIVSLFRELTGRRDSIRRLATWQTGQLLLRSNNCEAPLLNLPGRRGTCDGLLRRSPKPLLNPRMAQSATRPRRTSQRARQT